jgi:hypothetical protein
MQSARRERGVSSGDHQKDRGMIKLAQIHGGIGFTWDNDPRLWFKRAKSSEVLLGDANYHRIPTVRAALQRAG